MKRIEFQANGEDFGALRAAEAWLKDHGYDFGSMQGGHPIGVAKYAIISKWTRMTPKEQRDLDGRMESLDWRTRSVTLYLKPESGVDNGSD